MGGCTHAPENLFQYLLGWVCPLVILLLYADDIAVGNAVAGGCFDALIGGEYLIFLKIDGSCPIFPTIILCQKAVLPMGEKEIAKKGPIDAKKSEYKKKFHLHGETYRCDQQGKPTTAISSA